jgi:hypothetical protein
MLSAGNTEASVMRLPHPIRVGLTEKDFWELFKLQLGKDWPVLVRYIENRKLTLAEASYQATHNHSLRNLGMLLGVLQNAQGNTDQGGAMGLMAAVRQHVLGYTYFQLEDALVELLEQTDLDEDIPLSYLIPPYDLVYLELGKERALGTFLPNVESGLHVLEGAYVERGFHRDYGDSLYFVMTGSPVGHRNAADDATMAVLLPLADLQAPLGKSLDAAFHRAQAAASSMGMRSMPEHMLKPILESLILVAKALLYVSLPDARKQVHNERTEMEKGIKALKSTAKRAKAQRKLSRTYDYILVTAPPAAHPGRGQERADGTRTVKPHWRRGHYRLHRYGPELALRKLLLIPPTLVAAERGAPPTPKPYVVR